MGDRGELKAPTSKELTRARTGSWHLLDVKEYVQVKRAKPSKTYEDRLAEWAKKMLCNIAKAGYFSSDRSIAEYDRDIWKL